MVANRDGGRVGDEIENNQIGFAIRFAFLMVCDIDDTQRRLYILEWQVDDGDGHKRAEFGVLTRILHLMNVLNQQRLALFEDPPRDAKKREALRWDVNPGR